MLPIVLTLKMSPKQLNCIKMAKIAVPLSAFFKCLNFNN